MNKRIHETENSFVTVGISLIYVAFIYIFFIYINMLIHFTMHSKK